MEKYTFDLYPETYEILQKELQKNNLSFDVFIRQSIKMTQEDEKAREIIRRAAEMLEKQQHTS